MGHALWRLGVLLLLPLHAVISGLVTRYMYHRLLAPTFPGLPQHLGVAQALGLSVFVGWLTMDEYDSTNDATFARKEAYWWVTRAMAVLLALVIGWFMP